MQRGDLRAYLSAYPDSPRTLLLVDVIAGLKYLHNHGIIHADLKAPNILVSDSGHAVIGEFGIAHITFGYSSTRQASGTWNWTAPELLANETEKPSERSDIWSFGCLCYEVLTDEIPFLDCKTFFQLIAVVVTKSMNPLVASSPAVNWIEPRVYKILEQCLKHDPSYRPTSDSLYEWFKQLNIPDTRLPANQEDHVLREVQSLRSELKIDYEQICALLQRLLQISISHNTNICNKTCQSASSVLNPSSSSVTRSSTQPSLESLVPVHSSNHVLNNDSFRLRTSTRTFAPATDLAAHYGIPTTLPPLPRIQSRCPEPVTQRSPLHSTIFLDFFSLKDNYLNMLSQKPDSTLAPSNTDMSSAVVSPADLRQPIAADFNDLEGLLCTLGYSPLSSSVSTESMFELNDYLTSPWTPSLDAFGDSPGETPLSDFLNTPLISDQDTAMFTGPLFDDLPLFSEAFEPVESSKPPARDTSGLRVMSPTSPYLGTPAPDPANLLSPALIMANSFPPTAQITISSPAINNISSPVTSFSHPVPHPQQHSDQNDLLTSPPEPPPAPPPPQSSTVPNLPSLPFHIQVPFSEPSHVQEKPFDMLRFQNNTIGSGDTGTPPAFRLADLSLDNSTDAEGQHHESPLVWVPDLPSTSAASRYPTTNTSHSQGLAEHIWGQRVQVNAPIRRETYKTPWLDESDTSSTTTGYTYQSPHHCNQDLPEPGNSSSDHTNILSPTWTSMRASSLAPSPSTLTQRLVDTSSQLEAYQSSRDIIRKLLVRGKSIREIFATAMTREEAQTIINFLSKVLDEKDHIDCIEAKHILSLVRVIAKNFRIFPAGCELNEVQCDLSNPLTEGGYANIIKGEYKGQLICVKAVRLCSAGDNTTSLRVEAKEYALWAHLSHPNILTFYGVYVPSNSSYPRICIVSRWMKNGDLKSYLCKVSNSPRTLLISTSS
ncbi:Mitogen-activated protein kinase kinase kinase 12 [Leucoagaricus sp. SymC.cos]|nr:Mitogen-activated protein kinase kinase kinase 12 [Leucoagaricus sp. SymC.cos]